jgi:hypothetical protein
VLRPACKTAAASAACGAIFIAIVGAAFPLRDALQLGPDEHYELLKALMCSQGFSAYHDFWNDQPPLYTLLLKILFEQVGPTLFGARLLAVGFGTLLFVSFFNLVSLRSGSKAAIVASILLLMFPSFLELCSSVMLEVPALGTGLLGALALFLRRRGQALAWSFASGVIFGCALQIKLTAAIFIPALAAEIALAPPGLSGVRPRSSVAGLWLAGAGSSFLAVALLHGGEGFQNLWQSHFQPHPVSEAVRLMDQQFLFGVLDDHFGAWVGAWLGIVFIMWRRQWRPLAFPLVLFGTAVLVRLFHQPYWYFYSLQLALPAAWMAGHFLAELFRSLPRAAGWNVLAWRDSDFARAAVCLGLAAALLGYGAPRFQRELKSAAQAPRLRESPLLATMIEHGRWTRWGYSEDPIYCFHARTPVPPELLVLPLKRRWSGQITDAQIVACIERYRPEQVLLMPGTEAKPAWAALLQRDYVLSWQDKAHGLFLSKASLHQVRDAALRPNAMPPRYPVAARIGVPVDK